MIVVSSDLEEVLGVSNRIVVLAQGKQAGILDRARRERRLGHGTGDNLRGKEAMQDITLDAPKLFDLTGNVALVTGAGSGIGQRIAMGLAQCGADVALLDSRSDDGLAKTADFIAAAGRRSIAVAADVTNSEALGDAVARTEAELGTLTLAVNAAGIANANPAEDMDEGQFQTLMDVNLKGVFLSCQAEATGDAAGRAAARSSTSRRCRA